MKALEGVVKSPFLLGLIAGVCALGLARHFFLTNANMAAAALCAIALGSTLSAYLEENRRAIWERKESPYQANMRFAGRMTALFGGVFVASILLPLIFSTHLSTASPARFREQFAPLIAHNIGILFGGCLFSLLYSAGGLIFVLAWNALSWADALGQVLFYNTAADSTSLSLLIAASLLPHLLFEALGYVLAGMCGVFLGKALLKYALLSPEFYRVTRASLVLLLLGIISVVVAAAFEVYVASPAYVTGRQAIAIQRGSD